MNLFLFLETVDPHGGGTLVLRSSPRLIDRFVEQTGPKHLLATKTKKIREQLFGTHPFLQELTGTPMRPDRNERLMEEDTDIDGVGVRVVELVGEPGDVVLTHPWLLHAAGPNTTTRPRLMRASRVYHRSIYEKYMMSSAEAT